MTFEEAKKEVARRKAMYNSIIDRISEPYDPAKGFYKGEVSGLSEALDILAKVDTEPVANPDKMTRTELAKKLREIFRFKYLTVSDINGCCINIWKHSKPEYNDGEWIGFYMAFDIYPDELRFEFDLFEYEDEKGDIDYSKCIVEVE